MKAKILLFIEIDFTNKEMFVGAESFYVDETQPLGIKGSLIIWNTCRALLTNWFIQSLIVPTGSHNWNRCKCAVVLFSCWVVSNFLWPHAMQHITLPCSPSSPGVCSNSCSLTQWCHPTILSSVARFSSCPQSLPESGSFPVTGLFASSGESIEASASASVLPMNIQDWFPLELAGLISLQSKGLSRILSNTTVQKHQFFGALYGSTLTSIFDYWKKHSFDHTDFYWQSDVSAF